MKKNNFSGQAILEYVVIVIVTVAALIAMSGFLRRHIQGSWRDSADSLGQGRQYESGVTAVTGN